MKIKVKGASVLPSINALIKKIDTKKKLNLADNILNEGVSYAESLSESELKDSLENTNQRLLALQGISSKIIYAIILGKVWFNDLDEDEDSVEVNYKNDLVSVQFVLEQKQQSI